MCVDRYSRRESHGCLVRLAKGWRCQLCNGAIGESAAMGSLLGRPPLLAMRLRLEIALLLALTLLGFVLWALSWL